jgi:hypothetical protein
MREGQSATPRRPTGSLGNLCKSHRPVLDDAVRVEIELPWVIRLLRDTIERRVRGRGIALLERPPGEA